MLMMFEMCSKSKSKRIRKNGVFNLPALSRATLKDHFVWYLSEWYIGVTLLGIVTLCYNVSKLYCRQHVFLKHTTCTCTSLFHLYSKEPYFPT